MKYQIQLHNIHGYVKPYVLRPKVSIKDAAYWQRRIKGLVSNLEPTQNFHTRATVQVAR